LDNRRDAIVKSLAERNLLSDQLKAAVNAADSVTQLEDIYLPYRPKRRTRATIAKEAGSRTARGSFVATTVHGRSAGRSCQICEHGKRHRGGCCAALAGARDIIAERVSDDATARAKLRDLYWSEGVVKSKVMSDKGIRPPSSKIISTGANRWQKFPATVCSPFGAAKRKVF
jgi:uncharacterized protein